MIIAVTGTQKGCSESQLKSLEALLTALAVPVVPIELHHGDCIGVDDEAHSIAERYGWRIVVHPPIDQRRAVGHRGDDRREPKGFLERDADMAAECDVLVACPDSYIEQLRSGTWTTVRYARERKRRIYFIFPDGSLTTEGP